ncbi:uncharacterized protein [Rutidosis leptorrhynchoides]|uniref:uncharacterized protein n=1 Tax=Rutidosis leptorrhynchoides TaxID=125765 RepID=UPI003A999A2A
MDAYLKIVDDDSSDDELLLGVIGSCAEELDREAGEGSSQAPPRPPRARIYIPRDREGATERLHRDYFAESPTYPDSKFKRRYRMQPQLFERIISGSNNDINVLNRSPLFDSIRNGSAPPSPFTVNGHNYTHGYYLADDIYPDWATLIKAYQSPTDEPCAKFTRFQESARKDVERTFGVLQGRFNILRVPGRAWRAKKMHRILYCCVLLHNMIQEDNDFAITSLDEEWPMMSSQQQQQVCMGSSSSSSSLLLFDKLPPLSSSKKYPWFIVENLEDEDDMCTEFFSTLHDSLLKFQIQIPELYRKRIRGCFYGWLIISNHPDNVMWSLWNPVSLKTVRLPSLILKDGDGKSINGCLLTAPPDDPTCVLLLTRCDASTFVFCHLLNHHHHKKGKRMRWTEMSYSKQLKRLTYDGELLCSLCCCNGKIYALSSDGYFCIAVIQVVVKWDRRGEVMIQLLMFGGCPWPEIHRCIDFDHFIIGGRYGKKEFLFCVIVCYHNGTKKLKVAEVFLFRLDTGSIKWEDLECLKKWDLMTGLNVEEIEPGDVEDLNITRNMWEEMNDLKDTAIFYVDLGRDRSIYYNPAVASDELLGGGYIHIRDKMDGILHLYHVRDRTIIASPMPLRVVSTTHVSMWGGRLEDDGHLEANCTGTAKPEKDKRVVVTLGEVMKHNESSRLLDVLEMLMEHCVGVDNDTATRMRTSYACGRLIVCN